MFLLYILLGILVLLSYDQAPTDLLRDLPPHRRLRRRDLLCAVAAWCAVVVVWPLSVAARAVEAVRGRLARQAEQPPVIPGPRRSPEAAQR